MSDVPRRPVLRYHGGKWKLAPWIISHFPPHRVYVEPFGGAASVLMRKPRAYAEIYNDLDGEIVSLFRVLRDPSQARELIRSIRLTPYARSEFEQSYLTDGDPIEQARRTVVRSFMGFGSAAATLQDTGFRGDSNRSGTTPAHDWVNYPGALKNIVARLSGVVIENRNAIEVIQKYDAPNALIYADPPYPLSTRSQKSRPENSAYRHEMTDKQHEELADSLRSVVGNVVISGYTCHLYDAELYPDWKRVERDTYTGAREQRTEVLWLSPRTWEALQAGAGLPLFSGANHD